MPDQLPVHLNRESLHSLEVPTAIETDGSFDVVLRNHGEAVHVHVHLDDALSELASIDANNHYVQAGSQRSVRVTVRREAAARGKVKIVTGYGAKTRYVDVDLIEPAEEEETVEVDESLATPQPREPVEEADAGRFPDAGSPVYLLAGLAVLLAGGVAVAVPSPVVRASSLVVFFAALAGLVMTWLD